MKTTMRSALVLVLLALSVRVQAQSPTGTNASGDIRIRIIDATATPVVAAEVALRGEKSRTLTTRSDSSGLATFVDVAEGLWVITVRRVGVKPVTNSIRIAPGTNRFTVQTDNDALTLVGVRVVGGETYSARLDEFERRRLTGVASATISRQQIERAAPVTLSRMLRGISGLRVGDSLGSIVAISTRGSKPARLTNGAPGFGMVQCVMRVSVDGVLLPALTNLDEIVPNVVHGIEIFYGPARMPPELAGLRTDNWCGLAAIWTRDH